MLVLPADAGSTRDRSDLPRRPADRRRAPRDRRVRDRRRRWSRSASQVDRPATEYGYLIPNVARGDDDRRPASPTRCQAFEEKPKPARAEELVRAAEGVAWNAGMFLWRRRAIRAALERYTGLLQSLEPTIGRPALLDARLRGRSRSRSRSTTRSWRAPPRAARS